MKKYFYISLIFLTGLMSACSNQNNADVSIAENAFIGNEMLPEKEFVPERLDPIEYISWIEDSMNGLKAERRLGDLSFGLQYKPHDYIALKALGPKESNEKSVDDTKKEYEGLQYYTFTINNHAGVDDLLKYEVANMSEYQQRVSYFSFDIQNDLVLMDGADTLRCKLFHYERVYGLAPFANFLLGFEHPKKTKAQNDKVLLFKDRVFGLGIVKIKIKAENYKKVPELIF